MTLPEDDVPNLKESVFLYNISPELEQELVRRAERDGTEPAEAAANIIERHVSEAGAGETD
ncbi:MAG: hypothetical protein RIQ71_2313 [Verrucomicrobiota bacterium]|jgi:hypothetical protein